MSNGDSTLKCFSSFGYKNFGRRSTWRDLIPTTKNSELFRTTAIMPHPALHQRREISRVRPVMLSPRGQAKVASRSKFWPRPRPRTWPQRFGLGLESLASAPASVSASNIWPRLGLYLVVLLCNRAFFEQKSCIIRKFC